MWVFLCWDFYFLLLFPFVLYAIFTGKYFHSFFEDSKKILFLFHKICNNRNANPQQHQEKKLQDGVLQDRNSLLNPISIFRKNASKKPIKRNAVESIDDKTNVKYMVQTRMKNQVSYSKNGMPAIRNNNMKISNNIGHSFPITSNFIRKDIDFTSSTPIRILRSISLSPDIHSIELSPINQSPKYDNNSNPYSANLSHLDTPTINTDVNAKAPDYKTEIIKMKVNKLKETHPNERVNTKSDKNNANKQKTQRKGSPTPIKSKQMHKKISKSPWYEKPPVITSNHVINIPVFKKH